MNSQIKTWESHTGSIIDSVKDFDIIACRTCGFKHVIPIPGQEELNELYGEEFYSRKKPRYFKDAEEDAAWWDLTYRNYYLLLEKHCPNKQKRLLEIGSGPGYFLKCGKERGWDVLGFEPSPEAWEYSQKFGVKVINEFFKESNMDKYGRFDAVFMSKVIEHLPDPVSLVRNIRSLLKPNGIICLVSPNDYNPLQNVLRDNLHYEPWWLAPPQHINYFDFKSVKTLLERLGFEIVESRGTFPMEFFLLAGENYIGNDALGRECHFKRKAFELNMHKYDAGRLIDSIYNFLAERKIGREFVVIGKAV